MIDQLTKSLCNGCQFNLPMVSQEPTDSARRACRHAMKPLENPAVPIHGCCFADIPPLPDHQALPEISSEDTVRVARLEAALLAGDRADADERQKAIAAHPKRPIFMWYEGREHLYITGPDPQGTSAEALPDGGTDPK